MANQTPVGNGQPVIMTGPETVHLIATGDLSALGDLFFKDTSKPAVLDLSTTVTASRSGGGSVPLTNAEMLAALTTTIDEYNNGTVRGEIDWDFAMPESEVNFLAAGETLTLTYDIILTDPATNGTASQTVTVTILGVNHPPVFTSGPETGSVAELADTTGSAASDTATPGSLAFTDQDTSNTHTVAVSVASETWSGGSAIPATTVADLTNALATTLNDSTGTGSGSVNWTFSIPDSDLDFLAQGETLTTVYDVTVADGSSSATQTVTITAVGSNDPVTITSGPDSGAVAEQPSVTGSSTPDTSAPGTLSFTDADLSDTHAVAVTLDSAVWSVNPFGGVPSQTLADLQSALATTLNDSTGTGSGSIAWSFSIADQDLDFLGAGETLTATYDVTVSDAAGSSSTQNVVITMTGAEDPLVVNSVTASIFDSPFTDTGNLIGAGNVILDGNDNGGDTSTSLSVTAVNGLAGNVSSLVAGTYGDLFLDSGGNYSYIANASVDPLLAGQNVTDQFNFTVTDSLGRTQTTTLTFAITGLDDAPVITSADAIGEMTENAGPSTIVNGGFETGDLTGWSASSSVSAAEFFIGGEFGNYVALLGPGSSQSLSQNVATTPGQQYALSFVLDGDPDASSSPLTVTWDGATILSLDQVPLGFTQYTFDVTGDGDASTTPLSFNYSDDGSGILLDQVAVNAETNPATESTQGTINFTDAETGDTHVASFQPNGDGYVGTFSLDPVSEVPGSGSVEWHFSVDNSALQFLSPGQTLTQDYTVGIMDSGGAVTTQDVTIAIHGHA
jgi:VCBS repeat-containing protein